MKCEPDETDPFSFEGPEIVDFVGWVKSNEWHDILLLL